MLKKLALFFLRGSGYTVLTSPELSKLVAVGVAKALSDISGYQPLTKEVAQKIRRGNFIPRGDYISVDASEFRETSDFQIHFCCKEVGNDIQSGPLYCSDIAAYICFGGDGRVVGLCDTHFKKLRSRTTLKAA